MGNKPKEPVLHILAIDDNPQFLQSLALEARRHRCRIFPAGSLEEAKEVIEAQGVRSFDGVILDILCVKARNQTEEDKSFLQAALDYLKSEAPDLPRVVVTGDESAYAVYRDIFAGEKVLQKSQEHMHQIFPFLRTAADKAPESRLRRAYQDVFEVFDKGHLDYRIRAELFETLMRMDSSKATVIRDNLARIRRIQEAIYIALSKASLEWVPVSLFKVDGEHIALRPALRHLHAKGYHQDLIRDFASCCYAVASDNGSHTPYENPDYAPTRYTVQATVNMLMDLVLWFSKLMDSRQHKLEEQR